MIHKTRAVAIHTFKFGDNGLIAHLYTEQFGRKSFIIKGAYNKKALIKANLFMTLNLLELEMDYKPNTELQKIKEAINFPVFSSIPYQPQKNAISTFISEILFRAFKEEEANPKLFEFLFNSVLYLDLETKSIANFHLLFLIQLTKFAGFFPQNNYSATNNKFDLVNGRFFDSVPLHGHYLNEQESKYFSEFIDVNYSESGSIILSRNMRFILLEKLCEYYKLHIDGMGNIKSLQVLKEVFE